MKKAISIVLVIAVLGIVFLLIKPPLFGYFGSSGELYVTSQPTATVFVNNENIGETTVQKKLNQGEYPVKIVADSLPTSPSWEQSIPITKNTRSIVQLFFGANDNETAWHKLFFSPIDKNSQELSISSTPDSIQVYIDGTSRGTTPISLNDVTEGNHDILFVRDGYPDYKLSVTIEKGYVLNVLVKLPFAGSAQNEEGAIDSNTKTAIVIVSPDTGWLRVRKEPSKSSEEVAKVNDKDTFIISEEQDGWYKIEYKTDEFGWISKEYTKEVEES